MEVNIYFVWGTMAVQHHRCIEIKDRVVIYLQHSSAQDHLVFPGTFKEYVECTDTDRFFQMASPEISEEELKIINMLYGSNLSMEQLEQEKFKDFLIEIIDKYRKIDPIRGY